MKLCCCTAAVARGWNVGAGIHHDLLTHNSVISSSRQNQLLHSCALHSCIESAVESLPAACSSSPAALFMCIGLYWNIAWKWGECKLLNRFIFISFLQPMRAGCGVAAASAPAAAWITNNTNNCYETRRSLCRREGWMKHEPAVGSARQAGEDISDQFPEVIALLRVNLCIGQ